jgi:putative FmdB family regulatory protein
MPLYEYECEACGERFEVIQKFSDAPITECRKCGKGPVEKLLSSPAIQFKGEGWYVTDYARKDKKDGGAKKGGGKDSGGDAKKSESSSSESTSSGSTSSESKKADSASKPSTTSKTD